MNTSTAVYPYPCVGALIYDALGRFLLLHSHKWGGLYGIPGGKVHYGESLEAALHREVREETGLTLTSPTFLMVQELNEEPEFYRPNHFVSVNYAAMCDHTRFVLNEEWTGGGWYTLEEALALPLNRPTRELLETLPTHFTQIHRPLMEAQQRPQFVGVLNISPESNITGSIATGETAILAKAKALQAGGADLIELGARSISFGVAEIDHHEEQRRLLPALEAVNAAGFSTMVDTWSEATAVAAMEAGVTMINFTGREPSETFYQKLAQRQIPAVITYMPYANAYDMRRVPRIHYGRQDILDYFSRQRQKAQTWGAQIIADPNAGIFHAEVNEYDKVAHQLEAIDCLSALKAMGLPVYIYCPRKEALTSRIIMAELIHQASPDYVRVHEPEIYWHSAQSVEAMRNQ